jgi:toxin secretion/phage lysis holin
MMDLILPLIPKINGINDLWLYLTPLIFMMADVITGFGNAYIYKTIVSHKMRSGIIKKCGEMLIIFLTSLICFVLQLPHQIIIAVAFYMILMEAISILENLDKIGVPIPGWIEQSLNNVANDIDKGELDKLNKDLNNYYKVARYLCEKDGTTITKVLRESEEKEK